MDDISFPCTYYITIDANNNNQLDKTLLRNLFVLKYSFIKIINFLIINSKLNINKTSTCDWFYITILTIHFIYANAPITSIIKHLAFLQVHLLTH